MIEVDTLLHCRWIIPVAPADQVLESHSLAVRGGRIADILPTAQARSTYRASSVVELSDHALIPGLVNAHTHAPMSLLRGIAGSMLAALAAFCP